VLPHGGCVVVGEGFDLALGLAVVFLKAGVHGALGLADVGGVARVGVASGARKASKKSLQAFKPPRNATRAESIFPAPPKQKIILKTSAIEGRSIFRSTATLHFETK
jgi:hypothetical protein